MDEKYTGLNAVPSASQKSDIFNKTSINVDYLKDRLGFFGAEIMTQYGNGTVLANLSGVMPYRIPFKIKTYDTSGFWSDKNPSKLIIPSGFSYAEFHIHGQFTLSPANLFRLYLVKNNGLYSPTGNVLAAGTQSVVESKVFGFSSGILAVSAGDYFETAIGPNVGSLDIDMSNDYSGSGTTAITHHGGFTMSLRAYR